MPMWHDAERIFWGGSLAVWDNRALGQASEQATKDGIPLIVVFILSPQDYIAHDRSPRRIDFTLRNLSIIKVSLSTVRVDHLKNQEQFQTSLADLHIPLYTITHTLSRTLPARLLSILRTLNATHLFGNIEYEIDELRRDIKIRDLSKAQGVKPTFLHNKCVVEPGVLTTKEGKPYSASTAFALSLS